MIKPTPQYYNLLEKERNARIKQTKTLNKELDVLNRLKGELGIK